MSKDKSTKEFLETLPKNQVIDLCLQFLIDVEIIEKQLDELKHQLIKKVKTIEVLRDLQKYNTTQLAKTQNTINEINKEFVQAVHDWKTLCAEKDKEIESLKHKFNVEEPCLIRNYKDMLEQLKQSQTQLAIQELAEVERLLYESHYKRIGNKYYAEYEDVNNLIGSRIKALEELKGE